MAYEIELGRDAQRHLRNLPARDRSRVLDEIERQLTHQPTLETQHRFPMRPNQTAAWELWVDPLRVYYDVLGEEQVVLIKAVGRKVGNRVLIDGREVNLNE